nr:immunoglobulin heavy chain junction region [Macaca mulatta]MOX60855.1 immunoglobulin heavy chain junction region [Macaca mulatta]MOX61107.1 immunoglobulin heavy chain junction region [Macaca mulatta]MOX61123.1 immunoglobulin heavy chain junction region [Macaca mulatta]MOX61281.1 immunoglobulin heavy chain junction region [Macaca mulatta]
CARGRFGSSVWSNLVYGFDSW